MRQRLCLVNGSTLECLHNRTQENQDENEDDDEDEREGSDTLWGQQPREKQNIANRFVLKASGRFPASLGPYSETHNSLIPPGLSRRLGLPNLSGLWYYPHSNDQPLFHCPLTELLYCIEYQSGDTMNDRDKPPSRDEKRQATLASLQKRLFSQGDLPAFSEYVMELNTKAGNLENSSSSITNIILKDYSLTNKLLRTINSAFYAPYTAGSQVSTVSQAVFIMGFEQVRNIALGLVVFEQMQDSSQASELKDSAISSFMSGFIAKDLAGKAGVPNHEEAFVCSMFRTLGKHMVIYFFPKKSEKIKALMDLEGFSEAKASREILGLTYKELNQEVLKMWKFPETIAESARSVPSGELRKPNSRIEMLRNISALSNEISEITTTLPPHSRTRALAELQSRFEKTLPLTMRQIREIMKSTTDEVETFCISLNIDASQSKLLQKVEGWVNPPKKQKAPISADTKAQPPPTEKTATEQTPSASATPAPQPPQPPASPPSEDKSAFFSQAMEDVTEAVLAGKNINDVLTLVMEVMYRGFDLSNLIIFIRNAKMNRMEARFGLGSTFEKMKNQFFFPLDEGDDMFNEAVSQSRDIIVRHVEDPSIAARLPDWYRSSFPAAKAFTLYPIIVKNIPFGIFYGDMDNPQDDFSDDKHWRYMKTLRNQAVLSIMSMISK